ncbi:MAG TPA: C40 family peptidase [Galbitalea sp.]|jgi:cell wall-associated NlpC family hydrolase
MLKSLSLIPFRPRVDAEAPSMLRRHSRLVKLAAVGLVVPALVGAISMPAYGASAESDPPVMPSASAVDVPQTLTTDGVDVADTEVSRDSFGATAAPVHHAAAPARHAAPRAAAAPAYRLGGSVVAFAERYRGVPYVFGGASPAGFDCSGLVMFVFAHFGVNLPHSAAAQGRIGTRIPTAAARPGDVVVMNGGAHVGIYTGGGNMIDAPEPGRVVTNQAIWSSNYYIVRF